MPTPISEVRALLDSADAAEATESVVALLKGTLNDATKIGAEFMPAVVSTVLGYFGYAKIKPANLPLATPVIPGIVLPDGVTCTVDQHGRLKAATPMFSNEGTVVFRYDGDGKIIAEINWDGSIRDWQDLSLTDDSSVVTIGMLKELSVI